jgi:phosphate transport system permease protein
MTRPSIQPWQTQNRSLLWSYVAVAVIPAVISALIFMFAKLDFSVILLGVFLPLQLVAGAILGFRVFGRKGLADAILMVLSVFLFAMVVILLSSVVYSVIQTGVQALSWHFIYQNSRYLDNTSPLDTGGIGHAILGTIEIVLVTTIITVPLGLSVAVYLTQSRAKHIPALRTVVQALSGLPSVVAGLFILSFIIIFHLDRSGFMGSLALLPIMLPTVARIAEESLKLVPADLRLGALALGAPNYKAFFSVILPAAKTGIVTAILLGVARVIGETAPLVLTTAMSPTTNLNIFAGPIATLPTYVFTTLQSVYTVSQIRAWGAALVLLLLVAIIFTSARVLSRPKSSKKAKGK